MGWEIAIIGAFAVLTVGRVLWEKRTNQPEPEKGEAVGGWFGGVGRD